jgi:hypothetical protein
MGACKFSILEPLFDLEFLTVLDAGGAGTSNWRLPQACNGRKVRTPMSRFSVAEIQPISPSVVFAN